MEGVTAQPKFTSKTEKVFKFYNDVFKRGRYDEVLFLKFKNLQKFDDTEAKKS